MKLSIIIPAYNVEQYIVKCLESCSNQDVDKNDYEVIVINDGSTDNSLVFAEKVSESYPNIKIFSQQNMGLSAARNKGIEEATGDYIWFVDSDDWIEENCLCDIWNYFDKNLDLLQIQYRLTYDNQSSVDGNKCIIDGIKDGQTLTLSGGIETPAPFTIYKRSFLLENNLKFKSGIYHEDCEFKPRALLLANRVSSTPVICYNYYQRISGSITSNYKVKNAKDMLEVLNSLYSFITPYPKDIRKAIIDKISMWVNNILSGMQYLGLEERAQIITLLKQNKHIFRLMLQSNKSKYKVEGALLLLNPNLAVNFYLFLNKQK